MAVADGLRYEDAGVVESSSVLSGLIHWAKKTLPFRQGRPGDSRVNIGFYASVLDLGGDLGLALSTDGVGTKILIAEMLGRYDTIGIDCVAMNANDLICVGAEPIAMLDYVAVHHADPVVLEAVGRGLYEGARQAGISIPGGELAQLGDMIGGLKPGSGLDLTGACVGTVRLSEMLPRPPRDGDAIIGMASTGVHSNGYTLVREALFQKAGLTVDSRIEGLSGSVGEELLKPTRIYVDPALKMFRQVSGLRALAHITSDGFLNLLRIPGACSYILDDLPPVPPIFRVIQDAGNIPDEEMYRVFNMGVGMCVVVDPTGAEQVIDISEASGVPASRIGFVQESSHGCVELRQRGLVGEGSRFSTSRE